MSSSHHSVESKSSSRSKSEPPTATPAPPVLCYHNEPAPLKVVRFSGPTLGREFYGCNHWPRTCGFFKWAEEVDEIRDMQYKLLESATDNAELTLKNEMLEKKVKMLVESEQKKQDQIEELAIEADMLREGLYSAKVDRKLLWFCVLSWVFFFLAAMVKK